MSRESTKKWREAQKAAKTAAQLRRQTRYQVLLAEAHACARTVSNDWICSASEKHAGVSDVRWRIELRRRANPGYYAICEQP